GVIFVADLEDGDIMPFNLNDQSIPGVKFIGSGDGGVFLGGFGHQKSTFSSVLGVSAPACCARNLRSAALTVFRASVAHLGRLIPTSGPSSSTNSSWLMAVTSLRVLPITLSVRIDAAAWLIVQPSPSKVMSVTRSSSSIFRYTVTMSPQPGLPPLIE